MDFALPLICVFAGLAAVGTTAPARLAGAVADLDDEHRVVGAFLSFTLLVMAGVATLL